MFKEIEQEERSEFSTLDFEMVNFLERQAVKEHGGSSESFAPLYVAVLLLLKELANQSVCLRLSTLNSRVPQEILVKGRLLAIPTLEEIERAIGEFPKIVTKLKDEGESATTPLIVSPQGVLYFHRQRSQELTITQSIKARFSHTEGLTKGEILELLSELQKVHTYFEEKLVGEINFQHLAASMASKFPIFIITGGPGTGKTTVVSAILGQELLKNPQCKIILTAPTGKAANQMSISLREECNNLTLPPELKSKIVEFIPYTLHRLLKVKGYSREYYHNQNTPLDADLIVIDEASMISLSMFESLLLAIPKRCKIILLGDKNQLASVEEGAVFSSLCEYFQANLLSPEVIEGANEFFSAHYVCDTQEVSKLQKKALGAVIELTKTHRFSKNSNIYAMKEAIERSKTHSELLSMLSESDTAFKWEKTPSISELKSWVEKTLKSSYIEVSGKKVSIEGLIFETDPKVLIEGYGKFKFLTSHTVGPYGSKSINELCQNAILGSMRLESGLPIMIQENDYHLGVFNGDTGVIVRKEGKLFGAFYIQDSLEMIALELLPKFEVSYAMTIHKSQGSGYDEIVIIYPEVESQLLSRELLYTAITRAKKRCSLWMNPKAYDYSVENSITRESGIEEIFKYSK